MLNRIESNNNITLPPKAERISSIARGLNWEKFRVIGDRITTSDLNRQIDDQILRLMTCLRINYPVINLNMSWEQYESKRFGLFIVAAESAVNHQYPNGIIKISPAYLDLATITEPEPSLPGLIGHESYHLWQLSRSPRPIRRVNHDYFVDLHGNIIPLATVEEEAESFARMWSGNWNQYRPAVNY